MYMMVGCFFFRCDFWDEGLLVKMGEMGSLKGLYIFFKV